MLKRPVAGILLVTLIPQLTACTTWAVQRVPAAQAIMDARSRDARVRLRYDHRTVVVQKAGIVGDSVVAYLWAHSGPADRPPRVSAALADLREVAVAEPSELKTLLLVGTVIGGLYALGAIAAHNMSFGGGAFTLK